MKYIYLNLFLILFLNCQLSLGQQMPIDFSDSAENFSVWGGSGFSTRTSPTDVNNTVGQFVHAASAAEQGFYIDLLRPIDLDFQKTITLSFYAFDPNSHTVGLKLEQGTNPIVQVNVNTTSSQNNWIQLTFDFSTVGGSGTYNRLTILIDDGISTPGTYLIDDIDDGSTPTTPVVDVVYDNLVWADEFDTDGTVNSTNWHHQTQVIIPGIGWANNEAQHYTNRIDNSYVSNGFLNIVAKKESFTDQGLTKQYTSARLNSKFAFTYGRVDVRAKIPVEAGTWPAIWMLGKNINEDGGYWDAAYGTVGWPACGEIDIMEHGIFPNEGINFVNSALHTPCCSGGNPNGGGTYTTDLANSYHVYSVNWSPNQMTFLIDDIIFYIYNPSVKDGDTWPFFEDQFLLLNVAMGGVAGTVDPALTQATMSIDYVRVFQSSGLNNKDFEIANIKVYPNPATSQVTVSSYYVLDKIELYDMLGKLILTNKYESNVIDVSAITHGVYLLKIYSGERSSTKKIVIN